MFILIKPHVRTEKLLGYVLNYFETRFNVTEIETIVLGVSAVSELYSHHADKPFFPRVVNAMTSGPCVLIKFCNGIYDGDKFRQAALALRTSLPKHEDPAQNYVHCPDSYEAYIREYKILC